MRSLTDMATRSIPIKNAFVREQDCTSMSNPIPRRLTDTGVNPAVECDPQLGPDPVGPADEHRIPEPGRLEVERAPKPADLAVRTRSSGGLNDGLDGIDEGVAVVDRYTSSGVGERVALAARRRLAQSSARRFNDR
jgi:hypothetical protein